MKTSFIRKEDIKKEWVLIDAKDAVLGRLAVISANILRGKNKVDYTPNQDCGDYLVIINSNKVSLSGKKYSNKIYYRHTGYPGGIKKTNAKEIIEKGKSNNIIKLAIKRMMPKGPLGSKQMSNCRIYNSENHPHSSQKLKILDLNKMNRKNIKKRGII